MSYLLLVFSVLLAVGKVVLCKEIATTSSSAKKSAKINFFLFFIASVLMALFSLLENKNSLLISPFSLLIAFFLSASLFFSQFLEIKAMEKGSAALTSFIYSLGFLVPVVVGNLIWDEPISYIQILGVFLLLIALYLILNPKKTGKIQLDWIVFSFSAMFLSGVSAVLQKTHQYSAFVYETKGFLSVTLLLASLYSLLFYFICNAKHPEKTPVKQHGKTIFIGGILLAFLNFVNTVLTGRLPATVQFPIYHMGSMVLTYLISILFFKERYKKTQITGLILGVLSIIVIGIF